MFNILSHLDGFLYKLFFEKKNWVENNSFLFFKKGGELTIWAWFPYFNFTHLAVFWWQKLNECYSEGDSRKHISRIFKNVYLAQILQFIFNYTRCVNNPGCTSRLPFLFELNKFENNLNIIDYCMVSQISQLKQSLPFFYFILKSNQMRCWLFDIRIHLIHEL